MSDANQPSDDCLYYGMGIDDQEFWESWRNKGKPKVVIWRYNNDFADLVPSDAIVSINLGGSQTGALHGLRHVENLHCKEANDHDVIGYKGNAKIETIRIHLPQLRNTLPDCERYAVGSTCIFGNRKFDCKGKQLRILDERDPRDGFFREISCCFTNFPELVMCASVFTKFYEEAPELATNPDITLVILHVDSINDFDTNLFARKPIENLSLWAPATTNVKHDPNTELHIGKIIQHSECFDEFVIAFNRRFQRTKRCTS